MKSFSTFYKYIIFAVFLGLVIILSLIYDNYTSTEIIQPSEWTFLQESPYYNLGNSNLAETLESGKWIPFQADITKSIEGDTVYLRTKIPGTDKNASSIYLRRHLPNLQIFFSNKLIYQHSAHPGKTVFNMWEQNVIQLPTSQDSGYLVIKTVKDRDVKMSPPEIYIGQAIDIFKYILKRVIGSTVISFLLFCSALSLSLLFLFLDRNWFIAGLLFFLTSMGLWVSANNAFFQLIFNAPVLFFRLNYISFQTAGICFFFILEFLVISKYKKTINLIWKIKLLILLVTILAIDGLSVSLNTVLQYLLPINAILIVTGIVCLIFSVKGKQPGLKVMMIGMFGVLISIIIEFSIILPKMGTGQNFNIGVVDMAAMLFLISIMWLAINHYKETIKEKERGKQLEFDIIKRENDARRLFSSKLIESQENERNRIAMELHDSVGQKLLLIKNQILSKLKQPAQSTDLEMLENVKELADDMLNEIRNITYNLRPKYLDQLGLRAAIETIAEKISDSSEITVNLDIEENTVELIPKHNQINFFRIVQESLNNVLKHSGAHAVFISIRKENENIILEIKDNGCGINKINEYGTGITSMNERAKMLGGYFDIVSSEHGTKVIMQHPVKKVLNNE